MHTQTTMTQTETMTHLEHRTLAWAVVMTAALFFFYEFIQMNLFNSINVQLREAYQLNAEELGHLFSMYFYANALALFPVGNLIDRYSTKKLLLCAVGICTMGAFLFAIANVYWLAAMGRFLEGSGAAFCFLSCIRIASRWFPPKRMAFVMGVVVTMAMLGGLIAQTPFSLLIDYLGDWREALLLNAMLGVVIFFAILFVVQDRPPNSHEAAQSDQQMLKHLGLWQCIRLAVLNYQNWLCGLYTALVNLPVFILGGLWGIRYLMGVHGITATEASFATTLFFVGVIAGSLLYGWLSDYLERRVLLMIVGAILSIAVMSAIMFVPHLSLLSLIGLFFLIGLVTSSQILTYPTIAELNPIYLTSTAVSIDSICIMISGFVFPPFFGRLMEGGAAHDMVNGVVAYTSADFARAMLVFPVTLVIGLVIAFFIRETYCRPTTSTH